LDNVEFDCSDLFAVEETQHSPELKPKSWKLNPQTSEWEEFVYGEESVPSDWELYFYDSGTSQYVSFNPSQ